MLTAAWSKKDHTDINCKHYFGNIKFLRGFINFSKIPSVYQYNAQYVMNTCDAENEIDIFDVCDAYKAK